MNRTQEQPDNQARFRELSRLAHNRVQRLKHTRDGTVSREAMKQLQTIIRTAERNFALGHEKAALDALEWAA